MVRKRTLGLAAVAVGAGIAASRRGTGDAETETGVEPEEPAFRISDTPDLSQIRESVRITDRGVTDTDSNSPAPRSWLSKFSVRAGIYVEHEDYDSTLSVLEWRP